MKTMIEVIDAVRKGKYSYLKTVGQISIAEKANLVLLNYMPEAQWYGTWNFLERVSRGLIINKKTGEIVARPYDKFFNWGEGGRTTGAKMTKVSTKMDGSLGIMYRHEGELHVATRGSFNSDQAVWATNYLRMNHADVEKVDDKWTLLFEIIYPDNRIVIDYGDMEGLFLLDARNRFTGEYADNKQLLGIAKQGGFTVTLASEDAFSPLELSIIASELPWSMEGYVAHFDDGQIFKFKSKEYLRVHKLAWGLSFDTYLKVWRQGAEHDYIQLPDELYSMVRGWQRHIDKTVNKVKKEVERVVEEFHKSGNSRKELAEYLKAEAKSIMPYVFAQIDGKDIRPMMRKRLPIEEGK